MTTKQYDNYADLITFTRGSNATLLDSDGLLKRAGHNLLSYSEQFDNAAWAKSNTSVTANAATAPDGTLTADKLLDTVSSAGHYLRQNFTVLSGDKVTQAVFAKAEEYNYVALLPHAGILGSGVAYFNLLDGSVVSASAGMTATIESFGDGWYLCKVEEAAPASGTAERRIQLSTDGSSIVFTGDGTSGIYVWGAHLYRSDMPMVPNRNAGWVAETTYYPTTTAAYYAPRIEYDADGNRKGLLIEEARTNLVTYSNDFTDASWLPSNVNTTSNAIVGPDGILSATLMEPSSTDSYIRFGSFSVLTGETFTCSLWLKSATSSNVDVRIRFFNGIFTQKFITVTPEWQRFNVTGTATGDSNNCQFWIGGSNTWSIGEDLYIYGAQAEAGSFPTSYIPTSGSTATRSADVASIPTSAFGYNQKAGSVYVNGTFRDTETIVTVGSTTIDADADGEKDYTATYSSDPSATSIVLNGGTYDSLKYYPRVLTSAQLSELTS